MALLLIIVIFLLLVWIINYAIFFPSFSVFCFYFLLWTSWALFMSIKINHFHYCDEYKYTKIKIYKIILMMSCAAAMKSFVMRKNLCEKFFRKIWMHGVLVICNLIRKINRKRLFFFSTTSYRTSFLLECRVGQVDINFYLNKKFIHEKKERITHIGDLLSIHSDFKWTRASNDTSKEHLHNFCVLYCFSSVTLFWEDWLFLLNVCWNNIIESSCMIIIVLDKHRKKVMIIKHTHRVYRNRSDNTKRMNEMEREIDIQAKRKTIKYLTELSRLFQTIYFSKKKTKIK